MRMRTAFLLAGLGGALLFLLGVWAFADSYWRIARMTEIQQRASAIVGDSRRLALQTHELVLQREPRQREQWLALRQAVLAGLNERHAHLRDFPREAANLRHYLDTLERQLADHLAYMAGAPDDAEAIQLRTGQIHLRIAELQSAVDELEGAVKYRVEAELGASGQGLVTTFALLFGLYCLAGLAAWWFFYLRLHKPLRALESGIHRIRDGDWRFRPHRAAPDEIGSVVDAFNSLLDRQQETERALRESELELKTIIDSEPECVKLLDRQGRLMMMNPAGLAMIEADSAETVRGRPVLGIIQPAYREAFADLTRRVLAGDSGQLEFEITGLKGGHRWLETHAVPLRGVDGEIAALLGITRDITRRKEAEEALRRERDFVESLIETAQAIILVLDKDGRIVRYNRYLETLSGQPLAAMKGHDWMENFLPADERQRIRALFEHAAAGTPTRGNVNPIVTRDGEERLIEWHDRTLNDAQGRTVGLLAIGQDVTERLRDEAELDRYRQELEGLVHARTRELEQARDAAEAANRAKSVFLANMSHELRTPLNAILGFAQLMERDPRLPDDERANLATINASGRHLLGLINDVLEISRIEAGRLDCHVDTLDLQEMLDTLAEVMRARAQAKGLRLEVEIPEALPRHVRSDAGKLRQILLNLLSNAVKYSEHGVIRLGAAVLAEAGERLELEFQVRDQGSGIAAEELERIFQPFYQTELGIRQGEGTGLGLAICREYARVLGGELSAESQPGTGSVFRLRLPLERAAAPERPAQGGRVLALVPGQPAWRILVAEDHPDNQRLVVQLLQGVGFDTRVAADGHAALALFQSWRPQLVLMDMRMPGMDGYAATRAIRALPGGNAVPIIALTASAFEEDRAAILAAGCDELMKKPFEAERLYELLARHLNLSFLRESPDAPVDADTVPPLDLSPLDPETRARLRQAAHDLDVEAVRGIAQALSEHHPACARAILARAENYHLEELLEGLDQRETPA